MKKNILVLSLMLLSATLMFANPFLNVVKSDNSVKQYSLLSSEISFSISGNIIVTPTGGDPVSFASQDVKEILFTDQAASIILPKKDVLSAYLNGGNLYIKGVENSEYQVVTIYNSMGQVVSVVRQALTSPVYVGQLTTGVYFLKLNNNQTVKFVK